MIVLSSSPYGKFMSTRYVFTNNKSAIYDMYI
jgi:hypothetical protein